MRREVSRIKDCSQEDGKRKHVKLKTADKKTEDRSKTNETKISRITKIVDTKDGFL